MTASPPLAQAAPEDPVQEDPKARYYLQNRGSCLVQAPVVAFEDSCSWNELVQRVTTQRGTERAVVSGDLLCHSTPRRKFLRPNETFKSVEVRGKVFFTEDSLPGGGDDGDHEQTDRAGNEEVAPAEHELDLQGRKVLTAEVLNLESEEGASFSVYKRDRRTDAEKGWPEIPPLAGGLKRGKDYHSPRHIPYGYRASRDWCPADSPSTRPKPALGMEDPVHAAAKGAAYGNSTSSAVDEEIKKRDLRNDKRALEIVGSWSQPGGPFGLYDPALPRKVHTWEPLDFFPPKWHPILAHLHPIAVFDSARHSTKSFRRAPRMFPKREKLQVVLREESHYDLQKDLGILKTLVESFSHVTLVCESFDFIRPHLDFFPNIPESLTIHLRVPFLKELGRREGEMMDEEQLRRVLNMRKRLRLPNSPRPADRLTREEDERLLRKQELALAEELTADLRRFDPDEDYNPGGKVEEQVDKNFVVTYYELEKLEKRLESLIRTLSPWVQGGLRLLRIEMHYGPLPRCAEDIPPEDEAPRGSAEEYSLVTGAMLERNVAKVRSSFEAFVKHFIALNKRTVVFEHAFCPVDSRARFKEVDWKYDAGGDGRPKFRLSES
eukprot:g6954.t1